MEEIKELDEDELVLRCSKCGWKGSITECTTKVITRKFLTGRKAEFEIFDCPKCGENLIENECESTNLYEGYNPNHEDWDSGDFGDYGGE